MKLMQDVQLKYLFKRWSYRLALVPGVVGVLIFLGWSLGITGPEKPGAGSVPMYPLTSLNFIAVSISYYLLFYRKKTFLKVTGYILTTTVLVIGLIKLSEAFFGFSISSSIDGIIPVFSFAKKSVSISVMAPSVALGFVLSATGLLLNTLPRTYSYKLVHQVILLLFTLGVLALLGYMYQAEKMYGIIFSKPMSLPSGICFTLFALALLFLRSDRGLMAAISSPLTGSLLLRTLLPAAIILPALLGVLAVAGFQFGLYNGEHGSVYYVFVMIVSFVTLVVFNSYLLNKRDIARDEVERALNDSEQQIRTLFENAPEAVVVIDEMGHITRWNPEAQRLLGWSKEEVQGKSLTNLVIPPAYREAYTKGMERYHATGESKILGRAADLKAQKKDGSVIDVLLRISSFTIKGQKFFVGFVRDITDRKKMETQLQQFNELLSRQVQEKTLEHTEMLERVTDGFLALDIHLNFTYVNTKAAELVRKPPLEIIGRHIWDVFPEGRGRESDILMQQALRTQQNVSMDDYVPAYDLWLEVNMYPSRNGLSIFIKDISDQRKKEQEVVEARNLADKLIDSLPGVFYFYDDTGKFIRWNKKLEEVTGYTSEEIAAIHPVQLFPADEQEYITGRIQTVFEEGSNHAEANFVSKTGEKTPYYFRAGLMQYKGKPCLVGTGIDITEWKKAANELQQSEQKYKLLFEGNPLPMWMLSLPEYKVLDVNQACLDQYGYTRDEFLNLDIPALLPRQDHEKMYAQINRNFRGLYYAGVWRHQKKNKQILYADIMTHDVYDRGKPARLILAKDVTEQYLAEEKLRSSYDEIRKLTEYLQKVREDERTRISREIHDELGQLVTAIKMDISWINKNVPESEIKIKQKTEDALNYTDFMVASVRRIAAELRPSVLDDLGLEAAIKWQIDKFEKLYAIPVEADLNMEDIPLNEEFKVGLFRILQESLTNVARHAGATLVSVQLTQDINCVKLIISDNGKGFDPRTTKKTKTLGLLGMKERVEGMGGVYTMHSSPNEGTTVTVTVPVHEG